ncbi:MAG: tyrosine-type recombinase/integrase [Acidobacteria bacterium]|nr:tyrosine-type recombinase/integrase [Acidobacteriota bacterium]
MKAETMLNLYRRHTKTCTKGYPQNHRVFQPRNQKEKAKDCECPISAEGTLTTEGLISNRSTRTANWEEAVAVAQLWLEWGATTQPETDQGDNPTIRYVVDSFLTSIGPKGRNLEANTQTGFSVLLQQRLLPWCQIKGYNHIREFDSLDVTTKFTESWVNLQPTRNRKEERIVLDQPLADSTKKAELERLRHFFRYCKERRWLEENQATKIKVTSQTKKKYGMEPKEQQRIFAEIAKFDGGSQNATELLAFCMVMRYAGLRISDATTLHDTQLVTRASGGGWAIRVHEMRKTKELVYVPIPNEVEQILRKVPFKGQQHGKRYWFWSGEGKPKTATNNWYTKVMKPIKKAAATKAFLHDVSPHTFRHTFAISHLNAGTDIKFVSRWLGHANTGVTEKHYAHAIHSTFVASDSAYDESMKKQAAVLPVSV